MHEKPSQTEAGGEERKATRFKKGEREHFLNKTELKNQRGWTDALIEEFLLDADRFGINMHARSGPLISYYSKERVSTIELRPDFQREFEIATKRRGTAKAGVKTKETRLQAKLDTIKIDVPELTDEELIRRACEHYNSWPGGRNDGVAATTNSDSVFLDRICVNYLRHILSEYDQHLNSVCGVTGADEARYSIRVKVLTAIADTYPNLNVACDAQLAKYEAEYEASLANRHRL